MALLKTIFEFRGSFGGCYFKHDGYGQHLQAKPRYISKTFRSDMPIRILAFTAVFTNWKQILMFAIPLYWINFAQQYLYRNKRGETYRLTNLQWFYHFNVNREVNGLPIYTYPPHGPYDLPDFTSRGKIFTITTNKPIPMSMLYTGNWYENGYYGFQKVYSCEQIKLHVWYDPVVEKWIISYLPGNKDPNQFWTRFGDGIEGRYIPDNPNEGDITMYL